MLLKILPRTGLLLTLLTLCPVPVRAQSLAGQAALDSVRAAYHLPALLAAVIEPGRIRYVYAGVRRNDQPEPVRLTDYFHLASETKSVTSLLAAKLVEQGRLSWDSELLVIVPELRVGALPAYAHVTLGQLLSHRAGVVPFTAGAEYQKLSKLTGSLAERRARFGAYVLTLPPAPPEAGQA